VDFLNGQRQECQVFATARNGRENPLPSGSTGGEARLRGSHFPRRGNSHQWPEHSNVGIEIESLEGDGEIRYVIPSLPLLEGNYLLSAAVYDYQYFTLRSPRSAYNFKVQPAPQKRDIGTVLIPCQWELGGSYG